MTFMPVLRHGIKLHSDSLRDCLCALSSFAATFAIAAASTAVLKMGSEQGCDFLSWTAGALPLPLCSGPGDQHRARAARMWWQLRVSTLGCWGAFNWDFRALQILGGGQSRSMNSAYDCWGLVDGPVNLYWNIFLSWSIPTALLLLSWCWLGKRGWLKALVVWGNVFVPPLVGAAAKLLPCFSTQASQRKII